MALSSQNKRHDNSQWHVHARSGGSDRGWALERKIQAGRIEREMGLGRLKNGLRVPSKLVEIS